MKKQEFPEERRAEIIKILSSEGALKVPDLSERLQVSVDTIRRDLIELEQDGLLSRVHGGALPCSRAARSYSVRKKDKHPSVNKIARLTAGLIKNGQTVFLDSGTTAVEVARNLPLTLQATIVTNSPLVAVAVAGYPKIQVGMLPGVLCGETMSVVGSATLEAVKKINADVCIIGVCAIHNEMGVTTTNMEEAEIKRQMIMNSSETFLPTAAEKIGTAVTYKVVDINCIDRVVTETSVSDEVLMPYKNVGIEILRAQ